MSADPPPEPPSPESIATKEELTAELEKAAQTWEDKADEETHAAGGSLSKEMLYRATESGMRQAKECMEEQERDAEVKKEEDEAAADAGQEAETKRAN
jgi:hypothetical protein